MFVDLFAKISVYMFCSGIGRRKAELFNEDERTAKLYDNEDENENLYGRLRLNLNDERTLNGVLSYYYYDMHKYSVKSAIFNQPRCLKIGCTSEILKTSFGISFGLHYLCQAKDLYYGYYVR